MPPAVAQQGTTVGAQGDSGTACRQFRLLAGMNRYKRNSGVGDSYTTAPGSPGPEPCTQVRIQQAAQLGALHGPSPRGLRFSFGAVGSVVGRAAWPPAGWRWRRSWLARATVPIVSPVRVISQVARCAVW